MDGLDFKNARTESVVTKEEEKLVFRVEIHIAMQSSLLTVPARCPLCRYNECEATACLSLYCDSFALTGIASGRGRWAGCVCNWVGYIIVVVGHQVDLNITIRCIDPVDVCLLPVSPIDDTLVECTGRIVYQ